MAQNSRLPPYKLSPAEAKCFNAHLDQARPYLSARNFVLSLWFANCYKEVSDYASLLFFLGTDVFCPLRSAAPHSLPSARADRVSFGMCLATVEPRCPLPIASCALTKTFTKRRRHRLTTAVSVLFAAHNREYNRAVGSKRTRCDDRLQRV